MTTIFIVFMVCATVLIVVETVVERRPLSRNAYLEKRRILERDRAEWMQTNAKAPSPVVTQMVMEIDKKLLQLAERMPDTSEGEGPGDED
jgi:hypothetical protein